MADFFISFASPDREAAEFVHQTLSDANYSCFYQNEDIAAGANFINRMAEELDEARCFLALFSEMYFESKFARAELSGAFAIDPLNERNFIVPLLVAEAEIPSLFAALNFTDCRDVGPRVFQARLLNAVAKSAAGSPDVQESGIPEIDCLDMAKKLEADLRRAGLIFKAQCGVRDALVDEMIERDPTLECHRYEDFIERHYASMNAQEKKLHEKLREHTETIERLNRRAFYYAGANRALAKEIPDFQKLKVHLGAWLDKFDRIFDEDESVGLIYVGVLEGLPFPSKVEKALSSYIRSQISGQE